MRRLFAIVVAGALAAVLACGCSLEAAPANDSMPDVVGMTPEEAQSGLMEISPSTPISIESDSGIKFYTSMLPGYEVSAQSPDAGAEGWVEDGVVLTVVNPEAKKREEEKAAKKAAEEAERKAAAEKAAAEEAEKVAKWGKDYLKEGSAISAVEMYGRTQFPFGFKLHQIMGKIACEQEEDGSWFVKYTCDVTNEYGATAKNLNCEAQVAGTNSNPVVTYFQVY